MQDPNARSRKMSLHLSGLFPEYARAAVLLALLAISCVAGRTALAEESSSPSALRWWRGNLHTHTAWKEGDDFPEMAAEWYRNQGYNFVALTEHNVLAQGQNWIKVEKLTSRAKMDAFGAYLKRFGPDWIETRPGDAPGVLEVRLKPFDEYSALLNERDRFIVILAEEITDKARNGLKLHMNAINISELIPPQSGAVVRDVISNDFRAVQDSAQRAGRLVQAEVNHVNYKWAVTAEDLAALPDLKFFEVWNGVTDDNDPGDKDHPSSDEIWDIANTLRMASNAPPLYGLATDDTHEYHGNKTRAIPGRAWVMVRSRYLTPESLLRAMGRGDFYASTGVFLDAVTFDAVAGKFALRIKSSGNETFVTRFIGTRKGANLSGKPRLDSGGKVVETTLDYRTVGGPQIGEVFREVSGANAEYTLKGDELYVRALVTSSSEAEVPSTEFRFKRAWTQPVGWRASMEGKP